MADSENSSEPPEMDVRTTRSNSRETANANDKVKGTADALKQLQLNSKKFMQDFNPETSARENRKLNRKLNASGKKNRGALYDDTGAHIGTGKDICDCLTPNCPGCFFDCPKCGSSKCGPECRVNRKYNYEQADFEGIFSSIYVIVVLSLYVDLFLHDFFL